MESLLQDIRYGIRVLAKNTGFTVIAVLTLALGIGANTAIFSVVNAELLRPLPFRDPGKLVRLWLTDPRTGSKRSTLSYPDFIDWRAQNKVFDGVGAYSNNNYTLTNVELPAHLHGQAVSEDVLSLLGATPELGRIFAPDEDEAHHLVAILSHRVWKQLFGGDKDIIGRTITLNSSGYTVVGVMPDKFNFPLQRQQVDVWTTFAPFQENTDGSTPITRQRGAHFVFGIARLKPGITISQAQAVIDVIAAALAKQYPDSNRNYGARLVPEQEEITGPIRPGLLVLLVAVGLVLLIACVNVANLLLARASARAREIAIRAALGAGRIRVVRQLLTESVLLAFVAGAFGLLLAVWGADLLVRLGPEDLPRVGEVHLDGRVLAFTFFLSVLTGVVFGLAPALQVARANLVDTLKESALSMTAGVHRYWLRSSLAIVETALALVLLVSAGLLIRSLIRLQSVSPGFNPKNLMTSQIDMPDEKIPDPKKVVLLRELLLKLAGIPGVVSAAAIEPLPMSGIEYRVSVDIEGKPADPNDEKVTSIRVPTNNYFQTMQIPLLRGRTFTEQDSETSVPVVIINQTFAQQYFPGENPIGKHIRPGVSNGEGQPPMREIVGVVGNVKFKDLATDWHPESYVPFAQLRFGTMTLVVRSVGDPYALTRPIAEAVHTMDKDLPAFDSKTVEDFLDGTIAIPRFNTFLLGVFASLALLLTAVGLYGVISYSVAQRTHEIGIRMALGAQPRDVQRIVVAQGLRLAAFGVGTGLLAALVFTRFLSSMLFGIEATDPLSFGAVVFLLLGVFVLACYIPARRAMSVDPMVALRYE